MKIIKYSKLFIFLENIKERKETVNIINCKAYNFISSLIEMALCHKCETGDSE